MIIEKSLNNKKVSNVYFSYDRNYYNLIPITLGEHLFLNIIEDDFIFDGYGVSRIKDVTNIKIKDDICNQIIAKEGLLKEINVPEIIIENWKTVFESLKAMEINIIVEKQSINDADSEFIIGRVDKTFKNSHMSGLLTLMVFGKKRLFVFHTLKLPILFFQVDMLLFFRNTLRSRHTCYNYH